ncbi:MAG: Nif3-like dinuclear metal center hexameric protein, partial [Desulfonatronovibrionaceae bacterium]
VTEKIMELTFERPVNFSEPEASFPGLITDNPDLHQGPTRKILLPEKNLSLFMSALYAKHPGILCSIQENFQHRKQFGLGFYGQLSRELDFKTFISRLKNMLEIDNIILSGQAPEQVTTLACCPGSGADLAATAFQAGAQVFITGDVKFHQGQEVQAIGTVLDVGHFCLEEIMMHKWHEKLQKQLKDIEIIFIKGRSPFRLI